MKVKDTKTKLLKCQIVQNKVPNLLNAYFRSTEFLCHTSVRDNSISSPQCFLSTPFQNIILIDNYVQ